MMAFKTAGELFCSCITYTVVKTEIVILKRVEPKHVKMKKLFVAITVMVFLLIFGSVYNTFSENWSFLEGLYTWFITFTTVGFGDYVPLRALRKKVDNGEAPSNRLVIDFIVFLLPKVVGLSLMACILSTLVDSIDEIRHFRDRLLNCFPNLLSLMRRLLYCKVKHNEVDYESQETG